VSRTTRPADSAAAGAEALQRGAWDEARRHFETSLAAAESPQVLEQLGLAGWWLDDATLTFDARERAYNLYREAGDVTGAARVAIWLVWDCLAFRGDFAVASGWLERARRLLEGQEHCAEYGWLLLREGEMALFRGHDAAAAQAHGERAAELGRATADRGLEFTGLALEGLSRVSAGDVAAGMRCLDEATAAATAGEVPELHTVGVVCCWQIFACERIADYDRAAQWCARVQEFTRRWQLRPLSGICRTQYAGVLIWRGKWDEAEAELALATSELGTARPGTVTQPLARLGQLRLRQGRLDEAAALFVQAGSQPLARLGLIALALERSAAADAAADAERFLAQPDSREPNLRAAALELAVRSHARRGDADRARHAAEELRQVALTVATTPLSAAVAAVDGIVRRLVADMAGAVSSWEQAVALYEECGAPFEAARARFDLAEALAAADQQAAAGREARAAADIFEGLGATRDAERARHWLAKSTESPTHGRAPQLTGRQLEIMRLLAHGLSNKEIAQRLRLSDHTVKRHVANILTRLGLPSRAAAVGYAAREGLLPPAS